MLKKLCRCGKVISQTEKYCKSCSLKHKLEKRGYHKNYDKYHRDKQSEAFYNSTAWARTRRYVLNKYNGLDLYKLLIDNEVVEADTVHHIVELKENRGLGLDIGNLIPVSTSTHSMIHKMYSKDKEGTQRVLYDILDEWKRMYG